jgi:hypothetical protein
LSELFNLGDKRNTEGSRGCSSKTLQAVGCDLPTGGFEQEYAVALRGPTNQGLAQEWQICHTVKTSLSRGAAEAKGPPAIEVQCGKLARATWEEIPYNIPSGRYVSYGISTPEGRWRPVGRLPLKGAGMAISGTAS